MISSTVNQSQSIRQVTKLQEKIIKMTKISCEISKMIMNVYVLLIVLGFFIWQLHSYI